MSRNRTIYQSALLYVGPTGFNSATGQHFSSGNSGTNWVSQLVRVQNVGASFSIARQDVQQIGQLARIDNIIVEPPTVSADFSYYLTNGLNESLLGFSAKGGVNMISGLITKQTDEKNYFLLVSPEGTDAVGNTSTSNHFVYGIGNGFMSNYSLEAAVGGLPTASVSIEGLNLRTYTGSANKEIPAVNPVNGRSITGRNFTLPQGVAGTGAGIPSALRPGDIDFSIGNAGQGILLSGEGSSHIQSFNISVPLSREPLNRLGTTFAFAREIQFPVTVTTTINALVADLVESNLADVLCNDQEYNFAVTMRNPDCAGTGAAAIRLDIKRAKLESQNYSLSIGPAQTVDLTFTSQLGGPEDQTAGFFFSGSY
jgi:hypothetical protein